MTLITKTFNIRGDQAQQLLNIAARKQLETGSYVSLSDVVRDVIDAGLEAISNLPSPISSPIPTPQEQ
jgi:hypothetical protein